MSSQQCHQNQINHRQMIKKFGICISLNCPYNGRQIPTTQSSMRVIVGGCVIPGGGSTPGVPGGGGDAPGVPGVGGDTPGVPATRLFQSPMIGLIRYRNQENWNLHQFYLSI